MHDPSATPSLSFRQLVANHFADRPTLRDVIAHEGFIALLDRYPWISQQHPRLGSLEGFSILYAATPTTAARQSDLLDTLLDSFLSGKSLSLTNADHLSTAPPEVFRAQERDDYSNPKPQIDLDLQKLGSDLDSCLAALPQAYQLAQTAYWNGCDDGTEISRLGWLEQVIKAALLDNVHRQYLDADEKRMVFNLLVGSEQDVSIHALQVTLSLGTSSWHPPVPHLLITGSGSRTLCCQPSGIVRSYPDENAFATALRDELAERYRFDRLSWAHQLVQGDPLAYQAAQVLNVTLDDIRRVRLAGIPSVGALETIFRAVSNPAPQFLNQPLPTLQRPAIALPAWLETASPDNRFHYHAALLDLAALQGQASDKAPFADIEDLNSFANRRLREQLQAAHPDVAQHDPDRVLVRISQAIPASFPADARALYLRSETLTELAIARLRLNAGEVMTGLRDANGKAIHDWLTLEQVRALVHAVDVGAEYPRYVRTLAYAPPRLAQRVSQYHREWRNALLLRALQGRVEKNLSEAACQALVDFSQAMSEQADQARLAPLALLAAPGASAHDIVHGMFLLQLPRSTGWVLYRPFYQQDSVREFASLELLMAAIRAPGELQQSVLDWLDEDARPVYADDGFTRPHLHPGLSQLAHLVGPGASLVDTILESLKRPVSAAFDPWTEQLPSKLFDARIEAMILLASNSSTSNAQEKWALAKQAAWAAFNGATLFLHGTLANLVWLMSAVPALKEDFDEVLHASAEQRGVAATDLLTNLAMLLAHRGAREKQGILVEAVPHTTRLDEPAGRSANDPEVADKPDKATWQPHRPATLQITSWRNKQRLGYLTAAQRGDLARLQAHVSLNSQDAITSGRLRGLYRVEQRLYTRLQGIPFEVRETYGGMQIIGPDVSQEEWQTHWGGAPDDYHIVGRERLKGPWLARWNGEWRLDLALAGGMPKSREAIHAENQRQFDALRAAAQANGDALAKLQTLMDRNTTQLQTYDEMADAFSRAFNAMPTCDLAQFPESLIEQRQALLVLRRQLHPELRAAALYLEKQKKLLHENIGFFRQLLEPRFLRMSHKTDFQRRLSSWSIAAIDNDMMLFRRLLELTDHDMLREQSIGLLKHPQTPEQMQRYVAFRDLTQQTLVTTRQLLEVSEQLDTLLPAVLDDSRIDFPNKREKVDQAIRQRPYSTLIIRAQLLSDQASLTLDKTQLTAEAATDLVPLQDALSNKALSATIWSHDGLASADLPREQQIEVLNQALREYRVILGKAHYMQSFTSQAVNGEMLEAYVQELSSLVRQTETQLSNVLASIESGAAPALPRPPHRVRPGRRMLIRTSHGRSVLVERDQAGQRAVLRNPVNEQPAGAYELRGDQWHELTAAEQPAPQGSAEPGRRAARLLAQTDQRLALAARYGNEPNSLADLMDWHIDDLRQVAQQLENVEAPEARRLSSQLSDAIILVRGEKRRLLTDAYLNTRHPDANALRYLHEQGRLQISLSTSRKPLRTANDFLDVYEVRDREAPHKVLWEAHFHYRSADAAPRAFAKAHLKFWEARGKEREARLEEAGTAAQRLEIYRGDLRLEQIADIIPFPAA
jgi:hypothetical protein